MGAERLQIVLWKWRDPNRRHVVFRYSSDGVNELARKISAHLSLSHDIVCITDDPTGLDSRIRAIPLWDDARALGGCWTRLRAFAPDMAELIGPRFAWIDLDCVITGDLTPLFDRDDEAVFFATQEPDWPAYNGSMVMMNAGARAEVWDRFDPDASPALTAQGGLGGTDQAWMHYVLGRDEAVWTHDDGVLHFRRDCPETLPPDSRMVFFAGPFKPHMTHVRAQAPWIQDYD